MDRGGTPATLAGHLWGRALQEWSLLDEASKETYQTAVQNLRLLIHPGGRTLAAQDFQHIMQGEKESIADFTRGKSFSKKLHFKLGLDL